MNWKERLDQKLDVKSYGYKVNKWILRSIFILMVLGLGLIAVVDGVDTLKGSWWVDCPDDAIMPCLNPFYDSVSCSQSYCMDEFIPVGVTLGVKPSWLARNFSPLCVGFFFFGLLLNHLLYNRNFRVKKIEK